MVQNFQMLAGTELSINNSLMVTLIGVGVVFAMLALLVVIVEVMHFVLKENKKEEVKPETAPAVAQKNEQRISAGVMAEAPEAENAKDDGEFLAALSVAISVATGKPNGSFKIKSIKKG